MIEAIAADVRDGVSEPDDADSVEILDTVDRSPYRIEMDDRDVLDILERAEWSVADVVQIADFDDEVVGAVRYAATRQIERDVREEVQ